MALVETNPVAACIAAVLPREGERPIGTAFLVHESGLVVTCAHVLEQAGIPPGCALRLAMQGQIVKAHVIESYWSRRGDIAFAALAAIPPGAAPARLGRSAGSRHHRFVSYGFPIGGAGMSGYGSIGDHRIGLEQIQLYYSSEVTCGFSGAPLFDEQTRRVVGMIVAIAEPIAGRLQMTSFAIPSESLRAIAPELEPSRDCPYRDLMYFTEADRHLWHGRGQLVDRAREFLKSRPPCLAVFGPSGSGKSSLLRAGLVPLFRELARERGEEWTVIVSRPADELFEASPELQDALANDTTLILVIDQLEDVFVSLTDERRARFLDQLLVQARRPRTWLVLGMRDDFYSRLAREAPEVLELASRALLQIPMDLTLQSLRDIVREPAKAVGLAFDPPDLDEVIARAAIECQRGHEPHTAQVTVLPLLEVALMRIWTSAEDGVMRAPGFTARKLTEALTERAHSTYYKLSLAQQKVADRVLVSLIDPLRSGTVGKGVRVSRDRLRGELTQAADLEAVLESFINARIVVALRDPETQQEVIELIHDALITNWDHYEQLRKSSEELLKLRKDVEQLAERFLEAGEKRQRQHLLSKDEIAKLARWRARGVTVSLKPGVYEFIRASIRARKIRSAVLVLSFMALAATATLFGFAAWYTQTQQKRAEREQARAEREQARAERELSRAQIRQAAAILEAGHTGEARKLLRAVRESDRAWEWAYLVARAGFEPIDPAAIRDRTLAAALAAGSTPLPCDGYPSRTTIADPPGVLEVPLVVECIGFGGRPGATLTVRLNKFEVFSVQTGLYGTIKNAFLSGDRSVLVIDLDQDALGKRPAVTSAGDALTQSQRFAIPIPVITAHSRPLDRPRLPASVPNPPTGQVASPFQCDNGTCVVSLHPDGTLMVQRPNSKALTLELRSAKSFRPIFSDAACVSPDNRRLFAFPFGDEPAIIFDLTTGKELTPARKAGSSEEMYTFSDCAFSPLGDAVVYTYVERGSNGIQIWDSRTGVNLYNISTFEEASMPEGVAWDRTGKVFGIMFRDRVEVFDRPGGAHLFAPLPRGTAKATLEIPGFRMSYNPDHTRLLIGNTLYDNNDNSVILELPETLILDGEWQAVEIPRASGFHEQISVRDPKLNMISPMLLRDRILADQLKAGMTSP